MTFFQVYSKMNGELYSTLHEKKTPTIKLQGGAHLC